MGRYPEWFYDLEPVDPCDGCSDYVKGVCISNGGCINLAMDGLSESENRLVVADSVFSNDDIIA